MHTHAYMYILTYTHMHTYIDTNTYILTYTHTISPSALEPWVGGHIAGPYLWWVWVPDR